MDTNELRDRMIQAAPDHSDIIMARDKVADEHCAKEGWDKENLSFQQILVIRNLPEWQNPRVS